MECAKEIYLWKTIVTLVLLKSFWDDDLILEMDNFMHNWLLVLVFCRETPLELLPNLPSAIDCHLPFRTNFCHTSVSSSEQMDWNSKIPWVACQKPSDQVFHIISSFLSFKMPDFSKGFHMITYSSWYSFFFLLRPTIYIK